MRRILRPASVIRQQWPLLTLILLISAVFPLQLILGRSFEDPLMAVPVETTAALAALRAGDFSQAPEFLTLLTCAFLHGSFGHLFGNMIFLWIFAAIAAELLGHRWMLAVFVFTAICGSACHVALNPSNPVLGAPGAVMGFEGFYLAMAVRWHLPDPHVWPIARPVPPARLAMLGVLSLLFDFGGYVGGAEGIAYGAHLGGFIGGLFLGGFIIPMPRVALPR